MKLISTPIKGLFEIYSDIWQDERGWFTEAFQLPRFQQHQIDYHFIQDNLSFSKKGVLRGLHLQLSPYAQAKLVKVIQGRVLDVVVDLRKGSQTFGQVYSCELDGQKQNMLVVPEGFAHGFAALEDSYFFYKCSNTYSNEHETGIIWNDTDLNIDWKINNPTLSEKDQNLPTFRELVKIL